MMKQRIAFILFLLMSVVSHVEAQRIYGTVTDSLGRPIAQANITEIDVNHRVLSNTKTDKNGNFHMKLLNSEETRLRIVADGYMIFTQRSRNIDTHQFVLSAKTASRLSQIEKSFPTGKRNYVLTQKLFCGKKYLQQVPWLIMVELIGDSTIVMRLPVRASSSSKSYAEGRCLTFVDAADGHMLMAYNGEDAAAVTGNPNERSTWKFVIDNLYTESEMRHGYIDDYDDQSIYYYPSFILSLDELQHLLNESNSLARIFIDTESADNCWIMYPRTNFVKEMQKVLKKLMPQHEQSIR